MKRFIAFVILVLGAAVFIDAQPHEYYCPIPIRNLSYASILESENEFTFRTGFTPTDEEQSYIYWESYINEELVSNGIDFIYMDFPASSGVYRPGYVDITVDSLPEGMSSRTLMLETTDGTIHTIVQVRDDVLTFTLSPSGQTYPGDTQYIIVSGGALGMEYYLTRNNGIIQSSHTLCDGNDMIFGPFDGTDEYGIYTDLHGHSNNKISLRYHDLFMPDSFGTKPIEDSEIIVPINGGVYSYDISAYQQLSSVLYSQIEDRMNNEGLPGAWEPGKGMTVSLTVKENNVLNVTVVCEPNFTSQTRSQDTMFYICEDENSLKFIQQGDPYAELVEYSLIGTWLSADSDDFTITLSGSQPGVEYTLYKDGQVVKSLKGTGYSLNFGTFYGMESHGNFYIEAMFSDKDAMMNGTARMVRRDDIGGTNYISQKTFLNDQGTISYTDVSYFNEMGYLEQTIANQATSTGKDIVTPVIYDNMWRSDASEYLPYARASSTSRYVPNAVAEQAEYYENHYEEEGGAPFISRTYETGPSGRILSQQREGMTYESNAIKARYNYHINDGSERVLRLKYTHPTESSAATVNNCGEYGPEALFYTTTISEDNDTSYLFTNQRGQMILSRQINQGQNLDTYFIYDLRDNLVCVIQPQGVSSIGNSFTFSDDLVHDFCFTYKYDAFGNLIEKHVPGAGVEMMAYDLRGRLIVATDIYHMNRGIYRYFEYDDMDRIIKEGACKISGGMSILRSRLQAGEDWEDLKSNDIKLRECSYYSGQNAPEGFVPENNVVSYSDIDTARCKTLLAIEKTYEIPYVTNQMVTLGTWRERRFFYDKNGRPVQVVESWSDGTLSRYSKRYDFVGNLLAEKEWHFTENCTNEYLKYYGYDSRGRVLECQRIINGQSYAPLFYSYDDRGNISAKFATGRIEENIRYNIHGWRISQNVGLYDDTNTFHQSLFYHQGENPRYGGDLSNTVSSQFSQTPLESCYSYDKLRRLTSVDGTYDETISYDLNGNVLSFNRMTPVSSSVSATCSYNGNYMIGCNSTNLGSSSYNYDALGRLTYDSCKGLRYFYNLCNLPSLITSSTTNSIKGFIVYLADATKVISQDVAGNIKVYRGSFVFNRTNSGEYSVESIAHDEGRFLAVQGASGTEFIDTWHVRDYLSSVRAVYDITPDPVDVTSAGSQILEQNDYYAFGGRIDDPAQAFDQSNRYRYNGKEQLRFEGINLDPGLTDYGARYYAPTFGRWTTPDPLADKYYSISPYAFCNNNPVNFVDLDGRDWYSTSEEIEDENGMKKQVIKYHWTEAKSQEEMYGLGIEGAYLGEAVVVFNGYYDEKLGKDGTLTGEGAKAASVTVYGPRGADDIGEYTGFTMSSDFKTFGAIANGTYNVSFKENEKGNKIPKTHVVNCGLPVDCLNGVNTSYPHYNACSPTQKDYIYVHRTNKNGYAGFNPISGSAVSYGCLLIDYDDWIEYDKQINNTPYKLILQRQ